MRYTFDLHVPYICPASDNIVENNFDQCRCWDFFYEVKNRYMYSCRAQRNIGLGPASRRARIFTRGFHVVFFFCHYYDHYYCAQFDGVYKTNQTSWLSNDSLSTIISISDVHIKCPSEIID